MKKKKRILFVSLITALISSFLGLATASALYVIRPGPKTINVTLGQPVTNIVRFTFVSQQWWNNDNAINRMYVWNNKTSSIKVAWPGDKMTLLSSTTSEKRWYYDVDLYKYDSAKISRWSPTANPATTKPWNETADFTLSQNKRTIYINFSSTNAYGEYNVSIP